MEIATYKNRLEEEKVRLENELSAIGKRRTDNPNDWDVVSPDLEQAAFRDEIADRLEEMDERKAAEVSLEKDLSDINRALDKIEQGIYGRCEICNEAIEEARLDANPSARTCKSHLEQESELLN